MGNGDELTIPKSLGSEMNGIYTRISVVNSKLFTLGKMSKYLKAIAGSGNKLVEVKSFVKVQSSPINCL